MPRIDFDTLQKTLSSILEKWGLTSRRSLRCAKIFVENSRDGVYSHGLNRFPVFVDYLRRGLVDPSAEPIRVEKSGALEIWDGQRGPGMLGASMAMERAIELSTEMGVGVVFLRNNNHWMRGGTYGLQAAEAGSIALCFTNAMPGMPPWGGREPRLGNNPLVIAVPGPEGPVLLDMAMSQYSYGKMQQYEWQSQPLPFPGGWDRAGNFSKDPVQIRQDKTALPIGLWKGSGLALLIDILLTAVTGGLASVDFAAQGAEVGLSQGFICLKAPHLHEDLVSKILEYTSSGSPRDPDAPVLYPGQNMLRTRQTNLLEGIPVEDSVWEKILELKGPVL